MSIKDSVLTEIRYASRGTIRLIHQIRNTFFIPLTSLQSKNRSLAELTEVTKESLSKAHEVAALSIKPEHLRPLFITPWSAGKNQAFNEYTGLCCIALSELRNRLPGSLVVDAGAGSGTLTSYALSLGAAEGFLIESNVD